MKSFGGNLLFDQLAQVMCSVCVEVVDVLQQPQDSIAIMWMHCILTWAWVEGFNEV